MSSDSAAFYIKDIYRQTLFEEKAYTWLTTLTKDIGNRLSGSENSYKAINWAKATLDTFGLDRVWLQPVIVPHWERGKSEQVIMVSKEVGAHTLMAYALGNSVASGPNGVRGEVVEVQSLDELRGLPDSDVDGKIVFFNRPMDLGQISTFSAYGGAADQRVSGPVLAAEKGAIGVAIRSLSTRQDDYPHTGMTQLSDKIDNIPAVALSTNEATFLSESLKKGPADLVIYTHCRMLNDTMSYNVIGEIKGSTHPEEIILVGGHFDSWDVGEGAHDDGSGCMHSMEVLYRLRKMGYKPNRTIRCVLFMNEENGLKGGRAYADSAAIKNEYHMAAIESDAGGFTPQAFGVSAGAKASLDTAMAHMSAIMDLLEPYDIEIKAGGGGADIGPLKPNAGLLIGLRPDSSRYFDLHHSDLDVLENVHPRELATGSAAMTSLIFLLDQYGIGN
jgi:hypothetical protein